MKHKTPTLEEIEKEFDEMFPIGCFSSDIEVQYFCGCGEKSEKMEIKGEDKSENIKSFYRKHIIKIMEGIVDKIDTFIQYSPNNNGKYQIDEEEWDKFIKKIK